MNPKGYHALRCPRRSACITECLYGKRRPFSSRVYRDSRVVSFHRVLTASYHVSNSIIRPPGIVVKQHKPTDIGLHCQPGNRGYVRVPPASANLHFLRQVLTIVDKEVGVAAEADKIREATSLPSILPEFVIREKYEYRTIFDELEAHPPLWMLEWMRFHRGAIEDEVSIDEFVTWFDVGFKMLKSNGPRSIDVFTGKNSFQSSQASPRTVQYDSATFVEQRSEERKPHEVVPVHVSHEQVHIQRLFTCEQSVSQSSHSCSGVNDDGTAGRQGNLNARGVSSIDDRISSR